MAKDLTVLTLDAGGTNFDFSALHKGKEIMESIRFPSYGSDLDQSIATIIKGFRAVQKTIGSEGDAISFAFPGPADYRQGIIGDLNNLTGYRGGVPLKAVLEAEFKLPVFILNDASLFALGEARGGFLPHWNAWFENNEHPHRFDNLIAVTLGTGFGGGFVVNNQILLGDNFMGGEVYLQSMRHDFLRNSEEHLSIRAVKNVYCEEAGLAKENSPSPMEIAKIARGEASGNIEAAQASFAAMGRHLGDVLANLIMVFDAPVVIGGGIAKAHDLYFPAMWEEMNSHLTMYHGPERRVKHSVYNLLDEADVQKLDENRGRNFTWNGFEVSNYKEDFISAVGLPHLGTRRGTWLGAYYHAQDSLS